MRSCHTSLPAACMSLVIVTLCLACGQSPRDGTHTELSTTAAATSSEALDPVQEGDVLVTSTGSIKLVLRNASNRLYVMGESTPILDLSFAEASGGFHILRTQPDGAGDSSAWKQMLRQLKDWDDKTQIAIIDPRQEPAHAALMQSIIETDCVQQAAPLAACQLMEQLKLSTKELIDVAKRKLHGMRYAGFIMLPSKPTGAAPDEEWLQSEHVHLDTESNTLLTAGFSRNGRRILGISPFNQIRIWDSNTGDVVKTFRHTKDGGTFTMLDDELRFLVTYPDGQAEIWNLDTSEDGEISKKPTPLSGGHEGSITANAYLPAGPQREAKIATGSYRDGQVKIWSATTGKLLQQIRSIPRREIRADEPSFSSERDGVRALAFSPQGDRIAVGTMDGKVRVWALQNRALLMVSQGQHLESVKSLQFSPDGQTILSSAYVNVYKSTEPNDDILWDAQTGQKLQTFNIALKKAHLLANHLEATSIFSPDGLSILSRTDGGALLRDAATGKLRKLLLLPKTQEIAVHMSFSPDGKKIILGGSAGDLQIFDSRTGRKQQTIRMQGLPESMLVVPSMVIFSHDSQKIFTTFMRPTQRPIPGNNQIWSIDDLREPLKP